MPLDRESLIARNLTAFLQASVKEGQEAEIAVHPELECVVVFIDGEAVLSCSFNDLISGPGASLN